MSGLVFWEQLGMCGEGHRTRPARKVSWEAAVPLSEHEQRQLEQIEQALYTEDPKFAYAVRASDPRVHYKRRLVQAAAGFMLGVGLLLAGVILHKVLIEVAGFVVMLISGMWALNSWRHMAGMKARGPRGRSAGRQRRRKNRAGRPPLMERLEERWRSRQERGDR
jgi:hypothetical protein